MKKLMILATAVALSACSSGDQYKIKGQIEGAGDCIYVRSIEDGSLIDSVACKNGKFTIKKDFTAPEIIYVSDSDGETSGTFGVTVFVEKGDITIVDSPESKHAKIVSGTPANDANRNFYQKASTLIQEFRNADTSEERRNAIDKEYNALIKNTVEQNRNNLFGALVLAEQYAPELSGKQILAEIALFPEALQNNAILTKLKKAATTKMKTDIGQKYIDIVQNNPKGKAVSLKSVVEEKKNKYVLLDFWASWCGPCMGEVPYLVEAYDKWHKKGFEIYGVSFDQSEDDWKSAIKDKKMKWIHVSELKSFDNQAAKDYSIQGIPANFLIDSEGTIVASNLRGEALEEKLQELLGK